jgi:lipoprotein-anchoring transpeptidase ErfK/SrfK
MKKYLTKTIGVMIAITLVISSIVPVFAEGETPEGGTVAVEPQVCEHVWSEWEVTVEPTYFEEGSETRTCELCGETETAVIGKLTAVNKWVKDSGNKYYFGPSGNPVTGWHKIKYGNKANAAVKWCWFNKSGVFKKAVSKNTRKKWVKADGKKFYFTAKKKPYGKGFHVIGKKVYYMGSDKAVVIGTFKVGGKKYKTAKDGSLKGIDALIKMYRTFVLIDLSSQTLTYYVKEKRYMKTSVVTGTPGERATPTGIYSVRGKARNVTLTGPTWSVPVKYWMPFIEGAYGMHDAGWRPEREFKNHKTYLTNGSHGCVNMRTRDAARMYKKITIGTTVIVQK